MTRPTRLFFGAVIGAALACGGAPLSLPPAPDPRVVPLRDTSGAFLEASQPIGGEEDVPRTERWRPRTVEGPPPRPAQGRLIDLDVKGADIQEVCRLLADVGNVNIVVADDVRGSVTVRMKRVPWDQALEAIAQTKGLRVVREGDIVLVKTAAR